MKKPSVAVTGMGIVSSAGSGVASFSEALKSGDSGCTLCTEYPELAYPLVAALFKDFDFEKSLAAFSDVPMPIIDRALKAARRAPRSIQASLIAALEAWQMAGLSSRAIDSSRIGLVIAGQNLNQLYRYRLQQNLQYSTPRYALHFMDTDHVGVLSEVFDIHGEGFTIGGASASGNMGLIHAKRLLEQGILDVCLVVGPYADLSPLELQAFYSIGALGGERFSQEPKKASRPFDRDRDGFVWGQSSGCMVLEAAALDVMSYATIVGAATVLDANRSADPNVHGEVLSMQKALREAGLLPSDIQYINTHGSGSTLGDETELEAISQVFTEAIQDIWLNATKAIVGHGLWSAGIVEAIATLVQMQQGFLHPNINLDNPINPKYRFVGKRCEEVAIHTALSNSFGFGGINSTVIFSNQASRL